MFRPLCDSIVPAMDVSPAGTRLAMPCSTESGGGEHEVLDLPDDPRRRNERRRVCAAGGWGVRAGRRVLALDGSMLRGEPR
jgi:hypothetical protein